MGVFLWPSVKAKTLRSREFSPAFWAFLANGRRAPDTKFPFASGPPLRSGLAPPTAPRFGSALFRPLPSNPSQRGAAPTMESKMMNLAEFTLLGRVGKIKPFEGKTSVTICANFPYQNKECENVRSSQWKEVTTFSEATRVYIASFCHEG